MEDLACTRYNAKLNGISLNSDNNSERWVWRLLSFIKKKTELKFREVM